MVELNIVNRTHKDYISTLSPKLLLIAEKPLPYDKKEIFDSTKGITYLSTCFKSKIKSAETHVSYVKDNLSDGLFSRNVLFSILEDYNFRLNTDLNSLLIGFIGQKAFDSFYEDYSKSLDEKGKYLYINKDEHFLKILISKINKNFFYIPYIILPSEDENLDNIISTLNTTELVKNIQSSPFCYTQELIDKLKYINMLYQRKLINGFLLDIKLKNNNEIEHFKISDPYSKKDLVYCSTDEICKNDSIELIKQRKLLMRDTLVNVPVYTHTYTELLDMISKMKEKDSIKIIEEENATVDIKVKKLFTLYGDPNGTPSAWYDKWYTEVLSKNLLGKMNKKEIKANGYLDKHKYEWIYDIEVFKYDWLFVAKTLDGKNKVVCWNDSESLWEWIGNKILIGFNNAAYDDVVIRHAMSYPYLEEGAPTVKQYSDLLIVDAESPKYYNLKEEYKDKGYPPSFLSWDLNFHMPFDIRRNSLKKLTMSVLNKRNYDSSVPFDIDTPLTEEQRLDVEKYCELDVDNTLELFLPDPKDVELKKQDPKHKMREFAQESYDIRWNLIVEYNMGAKTLINKSSSFAGKLLCGEKAKPDTKNTYKIVDGKKQYYAIPELAMQELKDSPILDFYLKNQNNPDYITEKFEYYMGGDDEGHLYQFGFGGLHQALLNYGSENLVNMDVASLYPSLLVQYKLMSRGAKENPDSYEEVYHTRLTAKKEGKTLLNLGLKLILNGAIGAMLSEYNPLYDTWSNSTICVHGQLFLFILCKRLFDAGFNIVQTNTDGIMIEKRNDVDYMPICEEWQKQTRLVLEFDDIDVVQQNNVNNYYCKFSNGKVKSKGFYLSNEKFGKATSKILCNMVTNKPLLEGVEPRDYVIFKKHSVGEIYDGITKQKLEGRSLAFVVGYPDDPRTQSYYSRSRNERSVVKKDEKGKPILDENGNQVTEIVNTESKITGFTDHMLLIDDINNMNIDEINTKEYINFAKNLLSREEIFGPYYNENFVKVEEPTFLQALNQLKDNTDEHPTKAGVVCKNFLFECDYATEEEQREMIENCKDKLYRVVWSGNKSYHCIVRLDKAVTSTTYKKVWYYLRKYLNFVGADEQCCLPNKYTRVPDQINPKTGNMQTLYSYDKNIIHLDDIINDIPKIVEKNKISTDIFEYKGQINMKALERHIKKQNWDEGNRFSAVQKLSPALISLVDYDTLLGMIPVKLEKDHKRVIRAKYHYWEKYKVLETLNVDNEEE